MILPIVVLRLLGLDLCIDFWSEMAPDNLSLEQHFCSLFRYCSAGGVFENPSAHLSTLWAPFWLPVVPFCLHFLLPSKDFYVYFVPSGTLSIRFRIPQNVCRRSTRRLHRNGTSALRSAHPYPARSGTLPQAASIKSPEKEINDVGYNRT